MVESVARKFLVSTLLFVTKIQLFHSLLWPCLVVNFVFALVAAGVVVENVVQLAATAVVVFVVVVGWVQNVALCLVCLCLL